VSADLRTALALRHSAREIVIVERDDLLTKLAEIDRIAAE
jgi:hypothetical protein